VEIDFHQRFNPKSERKQPMSALDLKFKLQEAKQKFGRNEITIEQLYVVADAYIAALTEFKKRTKAKISIPSRGYIIRAS
jgi:hypothetical protein